MKRLQQALYGSASGASLQVPFNIQTAHQVQFTIHISVEQGIDFMANHFVNLSSDRGIPVIVFVRAPTVT